MMTDKQKIKMLYDFAIILHDRGLALDPDRWDYEKIAWEFIKKLKFMMTKEFNDLVFVFTENLACERCEFYRKHDKTCINFCERCNVTGFFMKKERITKLVRDFMPLGIRSDRAKTTFINPFISSRAREICIEEINKQIVNNFPLTTGE